MKKVILIYDDDKEILLLCSTILCRYNYQVETLSKCDNIISDIEKYKPDLIFMDLWIPDIGGEKAIALVKADTMLKVPILIFSANAEIKDISKKINSDGYLEKPFTISGLIETINKHLC